MKKVFLSALTLLGVTTFALEKGLSIDDKTEKYNVYQDQDAAQILPIYYDTASAFLRPKSKQVVDKYIYSELVANPNLTVEISSHTDYRGDDAMNQHLSERRAQSVVEYLISKGISKDRLVAIGYGKTKPVNNCTSISAQCSAAELEKNRRTEFKLLKK